MDGQLDLAHALRHRPLHQRPVDFAQAALLELLGQLLVRGVVAGHEHDPAGVLVEAVHDAGALGRATAATR